jgi:hypothetical protein
MYSSLLSHGITGAYSFGSAVFEYHFCPGGEDITVRRGAHRAEGVLRRAAIPRRSDIHCQPETTRFDLVAIARRVTIPELCLRVCHLSAPVDEPV